eukprot:scaffold16873_cov24-Tisochrysis_lutea.AAC.2
MANTQWEVSARLEDGGLRVLCTMTVVSCFQYCEVQRVEHKAAGAVYGGVFSTVTCSECCGRSPRVKRRSLLHSPFPPVKRSFHAREESKRPLACSKHARLPNRRFNSKQHQLTRHAHRQLPALSLSLLPPRRSFNSNSTRSQGMLTDGYRADSGGPAGYLPQGYGWAQWENDVRRWEMETGLSYEQVCVFEGMRIPVLRVLQACRPPRKLMFPLGTVAPHTASLPLSICNQQAAVCS